MKWTGTGIRSSSLPGTGLRFEAIVLVGWIACGVVPCGCDETPGDELLDDRNVAAVEACTTVAAASRHLSSRSVPEVRAAIAAVAGAEYSGEAEEAQRILESMWKRGTPQFTPADTARARFDIVQIRVDLAYNLLALSHSCEYYTYLESLSAQGADPQRPLATAYLSDYHRSVEQMPWLDTVALHEGDCSKGADSPSPLPPKQSTGTEEAAQ